MSGRIRYRFLTVAALKCLQSRDGRERFLNLVRKRIIELKQ